MFSTIEISDLEHGRVGKGDRGPCRVHFEMKLER